MQTEPNVESSPKGESKAARTACIAVLVGAPGLLLTAFAAANSTSLTIRADLVLTVLDMLVLVTAWIVARRAGRAGAISPQAEPAMAETLACTLAALCMSLSMAVVAWIAVRRIMAGGMAPQGSGVFLAMALNFAYAAINLWILRRWRERGRSAPSSLVRSQICLFSDKLASNLLIALSLGAALVLEGTLIARFIDPVAGLLIASATARWTAPVVRDALRGLRTGLGRRREAVADVEI
ncbi:cation transporter [Allomesorhizobium camelthorni]|uniref:Cation transporter n=1 Tax=Allomesorhizobium camelthorni TaxID=475069 RepID=A0A6G4WI22_9HYPH|nr:cation transporter [Mesorhizobium camelthorni]NGO53843.1 cation transporter [Mesorhizobium camelthorni]